MRDRAINRDDAGFTLTELLVVIVIVGVLAGIAITALAAQRGKAQDATAISDLRNAATAEEAQLGDSGNYVANVSSLTSTGFRLSPNTKLGIAVSPSGYCEVADSNGKYFWFDSLAGGVQHASTAGLTPPSSANGVCSSTVPTTLS